MKKNSAFTLRSGNKPSPAKLFGIIKYFKKRKQKKQAEKDRKEQEVKRYQDSLVRSPKPNII